jgi:hypothetical protein
METNPKLSRPGGDPPKRVGVAVMDSEPAKYRMLPVWFFIGIILTLYGVMIFAEGVYDLSHPTGTVLENLHPAVWWGIIMTAVGLIFTLKNRRPV